MVRLSVVVEKGASGGLHAADLQISDRGKPEQAVFVRRPSGGPAEAPKTPGEYTNRAAGEAARTTVLLFDLLDTVQSDQLTVWRSLRDSLTQMGSGDGLYLYLLTMEGTLTPIHPMGSKAADDHTWPQNVAGPFDKAMKAASHNRPSGMGDEDVVKKAYVAVETLANQMAALPGPRNIVWITNGIPYIVDPNKVCNGDWVECALYVPHLAVTLDRDQVAVDPLSYSSTLNADINRDMEYIAGFTGGRAYFRQDVRDVVKQIAADAANTYFVYYVPDADNWDSKFHKVSVADTKGVELRARQRYYAYRDNTPATQKRQAALAAAYRSPADETAVGLRVKAVPATAPKTVALEIHVDPGDILLLDNGGTYKGGLNLVIGNFGPSGPIGEPMIRSFDLNLTQAQHDAVLKATIPMSLEFPLKDGAEKVRVLVQDQGTSAVGSVTVPVPASGGPAH